MNDVGREAAKGSQSYRNEKTSGLADDIQKHFGATFPPLIGTAEVMYRQCNPGWMTGGFICRR